MVVSTDKQAFKVGLTSFSVCYSFSFITFKVYIEFKEITLVCGIISGFLSNHL